MRLKDKVAIVTSDAPWAEPKRGCSQPKAQKSLSPMSWQPTRKVPPQIHGPASGRPPADKIDVTSEAGWIGLIARR